ncbi:hypothetical protein JIN85_16680 [Luteolibacter pohnpeiensis]|uniref:Uncharacterized protein n=1 Tax=Luteolibacter pohnpeiensis TaxID=454153 RepID=A0A934S8E2_9BACT|nr:hypothetical protein [Luteolibacter pohnpeiensis]MBK1884057.1 hypothetical protein [Luteolibacter pohnpeiensis]
MANEVRFELVDAGCVGLRCCLNRKGAKFAKFQFCEVFVRVVLREHWFESFSLGGQNGVCVDSSTPRSPEIDSTSRRELHFVLQPRDPPYGAQWSVGGLVGNGFRGKH